VLRRRHVRLLARRRREQRGERAGPVLARERRDQLRDEADRARAGRRELDGVAREVREDLAQAHLVADDPQALALGRDARERVERGVERELERQPLRARVHADRPRDGADRAVQRERPQRRLEAAGVHLCHAAVSGLEDHSADNNGLFMSSTSLRTDCIIVKLACSACISTASS
jgi:hypothetical protein